MEQMDERAVVCARGRPFLSTASVDTLCSSGLRDLEARVQEPGSDSSYSVLRRRGSSATAPAFVESFEKRKLLERHLFSQSLSFPISDHGLSFRAT